MPGELHMMTVEVLPKGGARPNELIPAIGEAIKTGASATGKALYVFRVKGENKIMAVLEGGVSGALSEVNSHAEFISVKTVPLGTYTSFAVKVNGADSNVVSRDIENIDGEGELLLFWVYVDYKGFNLDELKDMWRQEAEAAYQAMAKGEARMLLYKVLAITRTDNLEDFDHMLWKLPLFVQNGDQVTPVMCSSLDLI